MDLEVTGAPLRGTVEIPGSKSHTIRAVAIAALSEGESTLHKPLDSADARAACRAYRAFGAAIATSGETWKVQGIGKQLHAPDNVIDVGNSGTTMRMALGSAALIPDGLIVLTGDEQVCRRPCGPLAQSLNDLGASVRSTRNNGCPPFVVEGRLQGGETTIEAVTSQYVSSLLLNCPLAENDSHIKVPLLYEQPYVYLTIDWLRRQNIDFDYAKDLSEFTIRGGQSYTPGDSMIPGDFSSATFFLAAGAMHDNEILCGGLDTSDSQGDKAVLDYLRTMGADVSEEKAGIRVKAKNLEGVEIDMNATPDALPMMAVLGCFSRGATRLVNVPQARFKETDRIAVMREELEKLGAKIEELEDGLVVHESQLKPGTVQGHGDHRVVMSLAIAASAIEGVTTICGAEAIEVTYPGFLDALRSLGGKAHLLESAQAR